MKHNFLFLILFCLVLGDLHAQMNKYYDEDSLRAILKKTTLDTVRVNILNNLAGSYFFKSPDSTLLYAEEALALARKLNYTTGIQYAMFRAGEANRHLGNLIDAFKIQSEAVDFNRKVKDASFEANSLGWLGLVYFELHDYKKALPLLKQAVELRKTLQRREPTEPLFNIFIGNIYNSYHSADSAFYFLRQAAKYPMVAQLRILSAMALADVFVQLDEMDSANYYYRRALKFIFEDREQAPNHLSLLGVKLAKAFELQKKPDSSLYFARYAFFISKNRKLNLRILESSSLLSQYFKDQKMYDSALFYQDISIGLHRNIFGIEKYQELELLLLEQQRRSQEQERFQNNILIIGLFTVTTIILVASILLFRSNRIKQKTNVVLHQALGDLKATQSQLIQSEKMASLGELTAGIAHEIQNPLNFVNNFSEVNTELIDDLKKELSTGNRQAAEEIADTVKENQHKINQHGRRADAIVKSMLQHSRASSNQKELTDINTLCEEYLRLAYHGYRAKDKSFDAKYETHFDSTIPKMDIMPQDFGRVLMNLINNAFYAVNEKSKQKGEEYQPVIVVTTKRYDELIEIRVKDNGTGIPVVIRDKIFQPFFTTKPTGQGTGLGLSLAYDIITKAHGGKLKVDSQDGKGCEFIILLPLTKSA